MFRKVEFVRGRSFKTAAALPPVIRIESFTLQPTSGIHKHAVLTPCTLRNFLYLSEPHTLHIILTLGCLPKDEAIMGKGKESTSSKDLEVPRRLILIDRLFNG